MKLKTVGWVLLVFVAALAFRSIFPKRITTPAVPRIVTVWDTVRVIDTAWVTRLRRDTLTVNVTERVTVTVPETLYVVPRLTGVVAVAVNIAAAAGVAAADVIATNFGFSAIEVLVPRASIFFLAVPANRCVRFRLCTAVEVSLPN